MKDISSKSLLFKALKYILTENFNENEIKIIDEYFNHDIDEFEQAIFDRFLFININGISGTLNYYIYKWFTVKNKNGYIVDSLENISIWQNLKKELIS